MLRPDLTLEVAKAEAGEVRKESEWIITRDSEFALSLKEFVEELGKPHRLGDRKVEDTKGNVQAALQEGLKKFDITRNLNKFCELPGFDYIDYFLGVIDLAKDLIGNAVEHGSAFCASGNVIVRNYDCEKGSILTVDQPNRGQDLNEIYQRVLSGACLQDFTAPRGYMGIRGVGTALMVQKETPYVWQEEIPRKGSPYEALGRGGTRMIMLETFERVKRVFNIKPV